MPQQPNSTNGKNKEKKSNSNIQELPCLSFAYAQETGRSGFAAYLGNEKIYIQSAMNISEEKKKKQEENSLLRINDSFKKIIIQKEKIVPHYDDNGIYITCLEDFLMGKL